MSIRNIRAGAGPLSAAALGLFLAAFAPANLATAPDGGVSVGPAAALADDDDRDARRGSLEDRFGGWGWGDDRGWRRGGDDLDDDDDDRAGAWGRGDDDGDDRYADRDDDDDDDGDDGDNDDDGRDDDDDRDDDDRDDDDD